MTEREIFEREYNERFPNDKSTLLKSGNYSGWIKQASWEMWCASASREGYKLVPVEPSKSCLKNLGDVIFDNFGTTVTEVDRCAEKAYKAMIGATP